MVVESGFFEDGKNLIRERVISWSGNTRAGLITEDEAKCIRSLEKQSVENKHQTVLSQVDYYAQTILNVLNKLIQSNSTGKEDIVKNILTLINDLLLELPNQEFIDALLNLSKVDSSLPYAPFIALLDNDDVLIKFLALYNLTILFTKSAKLYGSYPDKELLIKTIDTLSSDSFIGSSKDTNLQFLGIQLLQELLLYKPFKQIYYEHNLISNFRPINHLIQLASKQPNNSSLQLIYTVLLTTWVLSFNAKINKELVHYYASLVGSLLTLAKDSIKLKIVRLAVATLKNFVAITTSSGEQFKVIKIILFHDGLTTINLIKERKFASNGSDEELSNDLAYLSEELTEIVKNKLSSFDEYLTELENPNLISFSSPTHKSSEFWLDNAHRFKDNNYELLKRLLEVLSTTENSQTKVVLLNDLQYLFKNLGLDAVTFVSKEKHGQYKLLIMTYLDNNNGDSELKYEALKTIQLLVGHAA